MQPHEIARGDQLDAMFKEARDDITVVDALLAEQRVLADRGFTVELEDLAGLTAEVQVQDLMTVVNALAEVQAGAMDAGLSLDPVVLIACARVAKAGGIAQLNVARQKAAAAE